MIKTSSSFILEEFANITSSRIDQIEKDGKIKSPLHKEVLKFESTALVFWMFRISNIFPKQLHRLILDKMHDQYHALLKKHGYDGNAVRAICDELNLRYKTYDKFINNPNDFLKIGTRFAGFISEKSKTDVDPENVMISAILLKQVTDKLLEFREAMN